MSVIEFKNVTRTFGSDDDLTLAVDQLSFSVPTGSAFGLLGANGAGKTTAIRMMLGHLQPDQGEILILGEPPIRMSEKTRQDITYISENMQLPTWYTLDSAAQFSADLYPKWDQSLLESLAELFQLSRRKRYDEFSKGQRKMMIISLGLAQKARLMILDEPASGLDTVMRRHFLSAILDVVCDESRTVLFSSHILSDIERIVDHVAIMKQGRLQVLGELEHLKEAENLNLEDLFIREISV
ncbi:MAG: ABC transporter ATP-binding protein [Thermoguttaceae bacterium]